MVRRQFGMCRNAGESELRKSLDEYSRLRWACDAEFLHLGLKGGPLDSELRRGPARATDGPVRFTQCLENMLALGLFKGRSHEVVV